MAEWDVSSFFSKTRRRLQGRGEREERERKKKKRVLTSELDVSGQRMDDEWISESRQEVSEKWGREEERNKKTGRHSFHTHTHPRSFNSFTVQPIWIGYLARNLSLTRFDWGIGACFPPWGREKLSSHWRDGRSSCMFVDPSGSSSLSGQSRSSKGYCSKRNVQGSSYPGGRRDTNEEILLYAQVGKVKERGTSYST